MASISSPQSFNAAGPQSARNICQIVGFVCLAGFAIDMLVLFLPPELRNLEWRAGFMRQLSDRSIVFLLGSALTLFGALNSRRWLKQFSTFCMAAGVVLVLSCLLVITDGIKLNQTALNAISTQENQLRTQIQNAQANPQQLAEGVTPEVLQRFSQQLAEQSATLQQNARTSVFKASIASVGNLLVVGLGLIGLGRYGLILRRNRMA